MRSIIILCIFSSVGLVARAQLDFKGNPLTENTEYTAEETRFSDRGARHEYERFEAADGRSSINDIDADKAAELQKKINEPETSETASLSSSSSFTESTSQISTTTRPQTSNLPANMQLQVEARQLREFSAQPQLQQALPYRSIASPKLSHISDSRQSETYKTISESTYNAPVKQQSTVNLASGQALNEFLQSKTPEESQQALQNYIRLREYASQSPLTEYSILNDVNFASNQMAQNQQQISVNNLNNPQELRSREEVAEMNYYSPAQQQLQHAPLRWNQIGFRSRQDSLTGPARRPPFYRGRINPGMIKNTRMRGNSWPQARIGSVGPGPIYHHDNHIKGAYFGGPPVPPPSNSFGRFKPPVDVIYTRPPGFSSHGPPHPPPSSSDDASHWFPDADGDQPPPQKDILYSQLYAQSYDPHYYNYIAKTGKIKPWLYGKLGEHKEKSIWWELFAGFKKHGMKNIMNPMFLLGMTIPTLTLMLTALVQKRSLGRSDSGSGFVAEEIIEEYARKIREAIECNEKRIKDERNNDEDNECW